MLYRKSPSHCARTWLGAKPSVPQRQFIGSKPQFAPKCNPFAESSLLSLNRHGILSNLMQLSCIRSSWQEDSLFKRTIRRNPGSRLTALACALLFAASAWADEGPFFVTYTHRMEEPGNLEFATKNLVAQPQGGNLFLGGAAEFEYGATAWWTTEWYLDAQGTSGQSGLFTGYRWENRFRLLPREHWINPVLYVEFENINGADKSLLEVVGHDGIDDLTTPNNEVRAEKQREIETKLILSSHYRGWTIAENFIAEKNVAHEPYEFGYAAGISRPLALAAKPEHCVFCAENFAVGVEVYGGLGTHKDFGFHDTSHYIAPTLSWGLADGPTLHLSTGFGLTGSSARFLLRFGISYEVAQFGRAARKLLGGGRQ